MSFARFSLSDWFATSYPSIVVALLVIQYAFVNLIFTTYTQNIVILKDISAPLFSILVLFIWILGDLSRYGRWQLPRHGMTVATVAALLYWLTSVFTTPATASGVYSWGTMLGYFIQVWAMIRFIDSHERMLLGLRAIIITNVLIIGYGFTQLSGHDLLVGLGLIPDWGVGVFLSTYGNRNFFAGYILTTVPVLIGYLFYLRRTMPWVMLSILVGLNIYALSVLRSFNAGTALLISLPAGLLFLISNLRHFPTRSAAFPKWRHTAKGALLVISIGTAIYMGRCMNDCFLREVICEWSNYQEHGEPSARLAFYQMTMNGALRSPLIGRGLGSYNQLMPETRPSDYHRRGASHNTDHAHNELLEWLFETGIVGLSFFGLIALTFMREGWRGLRRQRGSGYFPLILFSFFGPLNLWLHAMSGVETRWTGNNVTLWFTIGLVLAICKLPRPNESDEPERPAVELAAPAFHKIRARSSYLPAITAVMAAVVVFYVVMTYRYWEADRHLRNNMAFTEGGSWAVSSAIDEAELAKKLNYSCMSTYYKLAYSYLVAGRLNDAMEAYRDLQSFAPNYAQIHINLAFLDNQMGYKASSAWEHDRAAIIENNTRNNRDAADYWLEMGDTTPCVIG